MLTAIPRRTLLTAVLILLTAPGCGEDTPDVVDPGHDATITQIDWHTSGGGDLHFEVTPADPNDPLSPDYEILVQQCDFQKMDLRIDLTPQDGDVHTLVKDIFEGNVGVGDHTFVPSGVTGTWTSITLTFDEGDPEAIANIDTQSILGQLYHFVHTLAAAALMEPPIAQLDWDTSGGGDLHFSIVPNASSYRIDVNQYSFQSMELAIELTSQDGAVFTLVDDIFNDRVDVNDFTFVPGGLTGTWTSITLIYAEGEPDEIDNIDMSTQMRDLYQFVHDAVENAEPSITRLDWDTSGGGDLHFSIVPNSSNYRIDVDQYSYQSMELTVDLTPQEGAVFTLVDDIFNERVDVNDYTFVPGGSTGSWTSITLIYSAGEPEEIDNIDMSTDMGDLYGFVRDAVETE